MRDTSKLQWNVPSDEWEQFRQHVNDKFGCIDGYLGREAELAMREYIDADGYARTESLVDRLVSAAGRSPDDHSKKIKSDLDSQDSTRIGIRVGADLKEDFCAFIKGKDMNCGHALARALNVYRDGGRARRLEDKLTRVVDDAESILAELNDDSDEKLSLGERKTIAICNELPEQFLDTELNEQIHEIAADGPKASDPTLEKYRELVIDRLNVEPHPNNPDLWIPESTADELTPGGVPDVCRKPVEILDENERAKRVTLIAGRRAFHQRLIHRVG